MLREARAGRLDVSARCLGAFLGRSFGTPEEEVGALLFAHLANDLHVLALGKTLKE